MSQLKLHTAMGVSDILPADCKRKRETEAILRDTFESYGYQEVEVPTFEHYDCYVGEKGSFSQDKMFRFFDEKGNLLSLRPDFTNSIARMAATKVDTNEPQKYMYSGNVYRLERDHNALQREITQSGIELIGPYTPQSDAEVIAASINAVLKTGVRELSVEVGQVAFFNGLVEQAGLGEREAALLRERIDAKDCVGIQKITDGLSISDDIKNLLIELPYMFGGKEVIDRARVEGLNDVSKSALDNLEAIYEKLVDFGFCKYISIDLGMLQSIDYYTGSIFQGYTGGIGFPIFGGGRYDKMMENFGAPKGAVGAAITVNRLLNILPQNDEVTEEVNSSDGEMKYLTVALAKGRLAELSMDTFIELGMDCSKMKEKTRKLIFTDEKNKIKFILVKASDVPTYVEHGAADIGIVGKDTILEENRNLYEMVDLGFGKCRMCVCGPVEIKDSYDKITNLRVASKYTAIADKFFREEKGMTIELIKLNGSVELAPLVGLSHVIVDIVETGKTLKENGIDVLEEVCELSARLVVNRVSMKMEKERIMKIVDAFRNKAKSN